jgi:hypothetical protein
LLVSIEMVGGDIPGAAVDEEDGGTIHREKRGIVPFWDRGEGSEKLERGKMMSRDAEPISGAWKPE